MIASRLNHRGHVIPALTDHLEDKGGVISIETAAESVVCFKCSLGVL